MSQRFTRLTLGLVGVLLVLFAAPAAAQESEGLQAIAARAYVAAHPSVTLDEARRRIEIQDEVVDSLPRLAESLGERYAGAWFDAGDGGRLKVGVVGLATAAGEASTAKVLEDIDALGSSGIEFTNARFNVDELERAQRIATGELDRFSAKAVSVAIDVRTNEVVVRRSDQAPELAREQVDAVKAAVAVPVREAIVKGEFVPRPTACTVPYCDRPLRGGVKTFVDIPAYNDDTWYDWCTTGFNATSRSDGKRYVLIAGHCVDLAEEGYSGPGTVDHGTKRVTGGIVYRIGHGHNDNYHNGGDAGIIRAEVPSYWQQSPFPNDTVLVDGGPTTTYDENYHINADADAVAGQVVCTTGSGGKHRFWEGTQWASWSWCGTVRYTNVSVDYDTQPGSTRWVNNLVETDICLVDGMSGGPMYKNATAYAVNSGTACPGAQAGWHYPVIRAEDYLNVNIVH